MDNTSSIGVTCSRERGKSWHIHMLALIYGMITMMPEKRDGKEQEKHGSNECNEKYKKRTGIITVNMYIQQDPPRAGGGGTHGNG